MDQINQSPTSPLPTNVSPEPIQPPTKPKPNFLWPVIFIFVGILIGTLFNTQQIFAELGLNIFPKPTPTEIPLPSPTPDPTTDWNTYTNNLLSFKYPQGWIVANSEGQSGINTFHYLIDIKNLSYQYGPEPATISISYWNNPQLLDIPTFQKQKQGKPIYNSTYSPIALGEYNGYFSSDGPCEPVNCKSYTILYKDKIFIIDIFKQSASLFQSTISLILSSIKFINQAVSTPTCRPRPACLDATPRCLIPETADMCPPGPKPMPATYICPPSGYVDCMPVLTPEKQKACSTEAMNWYKANCPNFKGGAL